MVKKVDKRKYDIHLNVVLVFGVAVANTELFQPLASLDIGLLPSGTVFNGERTNAVVSASADPTILVSPDFMVKRPSAVSHTRKYPSHLEYVPNGVPSSELHAANCPGTLSLGLSLEILPIVETIEKV